MDLAAVTVGGAEFQTLAASTWKLLWEIVNFAESSYVLVGRYTSE